MGAGKSTLLRVVCEPDVWAAFEVTGEADYIGEGTPPLVRQRLNQTMMTAGRFLASNLPHRETLTQREQRERVLETIASLDVPQLAELLDRDLLSLTGAQRRLLMIVRELLPDPALICVDEPLAGVDDATAQPTLELMQRIGRSRAIRWVSHHLARARQHADHVSLLAGGRVIESAPCADFFARPERAPTRIYIQTGNCSVPSPDARPQDLEPEPPTEEALREADEDALTPSEPVVEHPMHPRPQYASARVGPSNSHWVVGGRLGGAQMPGLFRPMEADLDAL